MDLNIVICVHGCISHMCWYHVCWSPIPWLLVSPGKKHPFYWQYVNIYNNTWRAMNSYLATSYVTRRWMSWVRRFTCYRHSLKCSFYAKNNNRLGSEILCKFSINSDVPVSERLFGIYKEGSESCIFTKHEICINGEIVIRYTLRILPLETRKLFPGHTKCAGFRQDAMSQRSPQGWGLLKLRSLISP